MKPIPYGRQSISQADIDAVVKVLKSDYLTQGPEIAAFEERFAEYVGSKYAVAVANGTAALHLCAMSLNVKPGDKVITTPITFAASANCVRYCGGEIIFADIDRDTYLLDIKKVRKLLQQDSKKEIKGIIPVEFAGRSVDMKAFRQLADEFGCWLIEDACHAPGGYFIDEEGAKQECGNGRFADLAIFSFHPVKHIASGEGGMITTNSKELYQKLLQLRTHGITRDIDSFANTPQLAAGTDQQDIKYPGWYMEMQELGYNYRLTDFQAALGLSQLGRAAEGLSRRKTIARRYFEAFQEISSVKDNNIEVSSPDLNRCGHAFHLYVIETENRVELYNYLRSKKIYVQIHYVPTHLMPYYQKFGWAEGDMPHAEDYYKKCISLPMFPTLGDNEQDYVIESIREFYLNHGDKVL